MLKRIILTVALLSLAGCAANAPSPQDTAPSKAANCAALRQNIIDSAAQNNNDATAVTDAQNIDYQAAYKNECE